MFLVLLCPHSSSIDIICECACGQTVRRVFDEFASQFRGTSRYIDIYYFGVYNNVYYAMACSFDVDILRMDSWFIQKDAKYPNGRRLGSVICNVRRIIPSQNQSQKRPAKKTRKRPKSQKSLVSSNSLRLTIIRQCWFWWNKVSMRRYWVRRTTKRTHVLIISIELFLSSVYCVISWFCAERFCMNSVICSQYCKECYVLP